LATSRPWSAQGRRASARGRPVLRRGRHERRLPPAGFHVIAAADGWPTASCTYICNIGSSETLVHLIGDKLPDASQREQKIGLLEVVACEGLRAQVKRVGL
jgi:hypothetical protein